MTSTATPRAQRASATDETVLSIRAVALPSRGLVGDATVLLPRERSSMRVWGFLGILSGLAIAYAGAIAAPTGTSYDLRSVEKQIAAEAARQELLTSERSRLLSLPSVLSRARRFGIVEPAPVDAVLAPRP